jgi:hypothetical protein
VGDGGVDVLESGCVWLCGCLSAGVRTCTMTRGLEAFMEKRKLW